MLNAKHLIIIYFVVRQGGPKIYFVVRELQNIFRCKGVHKIYFVVRQGVHKIYFVVRESQNIFRFKGVTKYILL